MTGFQVRRELPVCVAVDWGVGWLNCLVLVADADLRAAEKAVWLVTMGDAMFLGVACFRGFGWGGGWIGCLVLMADADLKAAEKAAWWLVTMGDAMFFRSCLLSWFWLGRGWLNCLVLVVGAG
jgi:hypothetical protein